VVWHIRILYYTSVYTTRLLVLIVQSKYTKFKKPQAQRALRRASGLSTVLLSSDEEEGEGELYSDAPPRTQERSDSETEARRGSYSGRGGGSSVGRGGSGGKKNNTTYSYSKSKIRSPAQVRSWD